MRNNKRKLFVTIALVVIFLLIWLKWYVGFDLNLNELNVKIVTFYDGDDLKRESPIQVKSKKDIDFVLKSIENEHFQRKVSIVTTTFEPDDYVIIFFYDSLSKASYEIFYKANEVYLIINSEKQKIYYSNSPISFSKLKNMYKKLTTDID